MSNTALLGSYGAQDSSSLMFRNRIINGDMRISQRYDNVSAHTITTGQIFYTIDRFFVLAAGANVTGQRIAGTGVNPYVYRVTGAASNTQCLLIQRIESSNVEDLANKTVTLQFEASATGITSLDYEIRIATVRDTFTTTTSVTSGTVTVSTTPTVFTVTTTLPAGATNGVQINLGKTSGLVASQTFSISGVQLEAGPVATPFERRPIGVELALCQRYFEKSYELEDKPGTDVNGLTPAKRGGLYYSVHSDGVSDSACQIFYKVTKRKSNNTLTFYTTSGSINQVFRSYSGGSQGITPGVSYNSANSVVVFADESIVPAWTNTVVEFCFTCDAEL